MLKVSVGVVLLYLISISFCKNDYTDQVIVALERTLQYMKLNAEQMNLDAMFGLVLAEANLQQQMVEGVPQAFKSKVHLLEYMTNETLYRIKPHLKNNAKNKLFSQTALVTKAWRKAINFRDKALNTSCFERKMKNINTVNKYLDYIRSSHVTEIESDNCMIELLRQQPHCCKEHKCSISANCQLLLIKNARNIEPAYGVTHSLLYLQIARSQECLFNKLFIDQKINVYCSYIYWEESKNQKFGFLEDLDDLLLEQVTLCGYEGYKEFLKADIIEHILSLQTDNGCFKVTLNRRRSRREVNLLNHGCADHTTGLAASALSVILRYQLTTV